MVKGFILYKERKIPFVIDDYRMDLFSDDNILDSFIKEYNYKTDYILKGQCYHSGMQSQNATFFVEHSMGSTCYLRCYIINMLASDGEFDMIGFQSSFLDDIFKYKYNYLDLVRAGTNLAETPKDIYQIPFSIRDRKYELIFRIGYDNCLGLLEDFDRKGEVIVSLRNNDIQECYELAVILQRLAMFMLSYKNVPFKHITLYKNGMKIGWFCCPFIDEKTESGSDCFFYKLDVMKYIPDILKNIAMDSGNKITKSVPLGHLGDVDSLFTPQRFMEQMMAFEYLFDKIDHKKAQDFKFPLKKELEFMFKEYPQLLSETKMTADAVSERIKEIRRTIAHGYAYYYDFKNNSNDQYLMVLLDKLIRNMSLQWMGFTKEEIKEYPLY